MLNIHLGKWCIILKQMVSIIKSGRLTFSLENKEAIIPADQILNRIDQLKKKTLPKNEIKIDDPKYYYLGAIDAYKKLTELHSGGNYYKNIISSIYYLEDDFGDQHSHFSAAAERSIINNFKISERVEQLEYLTKFSTSFKPESYSGVLESKELRS